MAATGSRKFMVGSTGIRASARRWPSRAWTCDRANIPWVNGADLRPPTSVYAPFENSAGRAIELTVGPNPAGAGSRIVKVVPVGDESALRNRAWIEGNLRKVDSATGGRVAYVYVPNTTTQGYESFRRYFYPQAHKDAIIVDERFNGGGQLADYYIDILQRPALSYWATRYGKDLKTPTASIQGPKALLINETAGSGGDYVPVDVPSSEDRAADRPANVGRPGRDSRNAGPDGWRQCHRTQFGDLDPRRRLYS